MGRQPVQQDGVSSLLRRQMADCCTRVRHLKECALDVAEYLGPVVAARASAHVDKHLGVSPPQAETHLPRRRAGQAFAQLDRATPPEIVGRPRGR